MPHLSVLHRGKLSKLILDLVSPNQLRRYLQSPLDQDFDQLVTTITYPEQVKEIVDRADEREWIFRLLEVLLTLNPDSENLWKLTRDIKQLDEAPFATYEKYVKGGDMLDFYLFQQRIARIDRAVCSMVVESIKSEVGTGFLIGPDLLLTNYHVVEPILIRADEVVSIKLKFDYRSKDTMTLISFDASEIEVVSSSLPAGDQEEEKSLDDEWDINLLDYALIKLPRELGNEAYGQLHNNFNGMAPIRGWLPLRNPQEPLQRDTSRIVLIAQHPRGENMKLAQGNIDGMDKNHCRLRYRTNTDKGSSGAPVFNESMELVALHHRANSQGLTNQGVPISTIIEQLKNIPGFNLPAPPQADTMVPLGWAAQQGVEVNNIIEVLYNKPFIGRNKLKNYFSEINKGEKLSPVLLINGRNRVGRSYIYNFLDRLSSLGHFKVIKVDFRRQVELNPQDIAREIAILVDLKPYHQTDERNRREDFKQQIFLNLLQIHLEKSERTFLFFFDHCDEAVMTIATRDFIVDLANVIGRESVEGLFVGIGLSIYDQDRINGERPTVSNFKKIDIKEYFQLFYENLRLTHPTLDDEDKVEFVTLAMSKLPDSLFTDTSIVNVEKVSQRVAIIGQSLRELLSQKVLAKVDTDTDAKDDKWDW